MRPEWRNAIRHCNWAELEKCAWLEPSPAMLPIVRELLLGFADSEHEAPIRKVLEVLNQRHQLAVIPDNANFLPTSSQRWAVIGRHNPIGHYTMAISHVYKSKAHLVTFLVKQQFDKIELECIESHAGDSKNWLQQAHEQINANKSVEIPYNFAVRRLKQEMNRHDKIKTPKYLNSHWRRELAGVAGEIPHPAEFLNRVEVHPRDMILAVESERHSSEWFLPAIESIPCMDEIARIEASHHLKIEQRTAYIIDQLYGDMEAMFEFVTQGQLLMCFRDMAWWLNGDGQIELSAIFNGMADSIARDGAQSPALKALLPKTVFALRQLLSDGMKEKIEYYSKRAMVA